MSNPIAAVWKPIRDRFFSKSPKRLKDFLTLTSLRGMDIVTGILKDVLLTKTFGLGYFLDSYFIAISYLDMASGYFQQMGYGILVPFYNDHADSEKPPGHVTERQRQIVVAFMNYIFLTMAFLAIFIVIGHDWIAQFAAPNLAKNYHDLAFNMLIMITLPLSMIFQGSYALRLILVQQERFGWFHIPGIVSTLLFVVLVWLFYGKYGYWAVIWAMPISQLVQVAMYWYALGMKWEFLLRIEGIGQMLRFSLPNTFICIFFYLFIPVDNYFLAHLPEGQLSAFRYAGKIINILGTLTVFGLQMTLIPKLMRAGSQKDWPQMQGIMNQGLKECLLFSLPMILLAYWLSPLMVQLLFERGAFKTNDTGMVVHFMQILSLQLPYLGLWMLISRSFNSLYLLKPFMILGVFSLGLRIGLDYIGLQWAGTDGLAWMITTHYYAMLLTGFGFLVFLMRKYPPGKTT
ncbi:MAG: lipid II flippase MurJ [Candidatus Melainabacteria bacterium]